MPFVITKTGARLVFDWYRSIAEIEGVVKSSIDELHREEVLSLASVEHDQTIGFKSAEHESTDKEKEDKSYLMAHFKVLWFHAEGGIKVRRR